MARAGLAAALLVATLLAAALVSPAGGGEQTGRSALASPAGGAPPLQGGAGVGSHGGLRYVALPAGSATVVAAVSAFGGRVVRSTAVPGRWGVPVVAADGSTAGLSYDGRTLVLAEAASPQGASTRFAVLEAETLRPARRISLRGSFSFDALSPDGRLLYLVEHVPGADRSRYRVRAYDLARRRLLQGAVVDKRSNETTMSGYPLARDESADGSWVYTLYDGTEHPFVHALQTEERAAICIDLPHGSTPARLAVAGGEILVRDRFGKLLAAIDGRTLEPRTLQIGG